MPRVLKNTTDNPLQRDHCKKIILTREETEGIACHPWTLYTMGFPVMISGLFPCRMVKETPWRVNLFGQEIGTTEPMPRTLLTCRQGVNDNNVARLLVYCRVFLHCRASSCQYTSHPNNVHQLHSHLFHNYESISLPFWMKQNSHSSWCKFSDKKRQLSSEWNRQHFWIKKESSENKKTKTMLEPKTYKIRICQTSHQLFAACAQSTAVQAHEYFLEKSYGHTVQFHIQLREPSQTAFWHLFPAAPRGIHNISSQ